MTLQKLKNKILSDRTFASLFQRVIYSLAFLLLFSLLACNNSGETYHHDGHIDSKLPPREPVISHGSTTAHTSDYVCPLHCEGSGSDKEGLCPVCGLTYEPLKKHISNGHNH